MMLSYENDFKSHRPDGRFMTHIGAHMEMLRNWKPLLRLPEAISKDSFAQWQSNVKLKLAELLDMPQVSGQPAPVRLSSEQKDGYRLEKWEMYPNEYSAVPFLMLVPDSVSEINKAPAVLCLPGSNTSKEWLAGETPTWVAKSAMKYPERNKMAWHMAKNGMVAIAIDNPCTGETGFGSGAYRTHMHLVNGYMTFGMSYPAVTTMQLMMALDFVKTLDFVDASRIAVSGHSLGTMPSVFLALLRDEVKAVVFNDFIGNTMNRYTTITEIDEERLNDYLSVWCIIPGMWKWFNYMDLVAALAPKFVALNEGGATEHINTVRRAFECVDASERLQVTQYPMFADPAMRIHDNEKLPDHGLSHAEYYTRCYVDAPDHSFRPEPSLALLKKCFGL